MTGHPDGCVCRACSQARQRMQDAVNKLLAALSAADAGCYRPVEWTTGQPS